MESASGGGRRSSLPASASSAGPFPKEKTAEEWVPVLFGGGTSPPLSCPLTMDSVPATVPSVSASPGDSELLGPLSVLYAALIAKLLEVTVPILREEPQLWQAGGRVVSGVGG